MHQNTPAATEHEGADDTQHAEVQTVDTQNTGTQNSMMEVNLPFTQETANPTTDAAVDGRK